MHRLVQRAAPLRPAGALSFGDCGIGRRRPRLGRDRRNVRGRFRRRFASGLDFDRRFGRRARAREARLRPAGIAHSQVGHDSFGDQVDRWLVRDHKHAYCVRYVLCAFAHMEKGQIEHAVGKVQAGYGDLKEDLKKV